MRTEKEIRERFKDIEVVMKIYLELDLFDPVFVAFHTVLEWVLQDSEPGGKSQMSVQCRMCEAGEYDSLDSLKAHLEKEHELTEDDLIQYGENFSYDIELLIYKEKRSKLSDKARERYAKALGLKE